MTLALRFATVFAAMVLAACQTDGSPGPTTTSQAAAAGVDCGGPVATSRSVEGADPALKFPTEASEFCFPSRSRITLYKPGNAGTDRRPAVIVLPHCASMDRYIYEWMGTFTREGYVVLGLDYYTPRGLPNNCWPNTRMNEHGLVRDVAAAYAHLKTLPFVDADRVAVVGYSLGGTVALQAARDTPYEANGIPAQFKAVVAFYPPLTLSSSINPSRLPNKIGVPTLVLFGSSDTESPHTPTLVKRMAESGSPIELKTYSGAYHTFDDPALRSARRRVAFGINVIDMYDASAASQSRTDTLAFLAKHLNKAE